MVEYKPDAVTRPRDTTDVRRDNSWVSNRTSAAGILDKRDSQDWVKYWELSQISTPPEDDWYVFVSQERHFGDSSEQKGLKAYQRSGALWQVTHDEQALTPDDEQGVRRCCQPTEFWPRSSLQVLLPQLGRKRPDYLYSRVRLLRESPSKKKHGESCIYRRCC